jgi:hypothetical protein
VVTSVSAQCPENNGSWQTLDVSVPNPAGTITFDDLGFVANLGWAYYDPPHTVYNENGRTVLISGSSGLLIKGGASFSSGAQWDGSENYADGLGKPGYYWGLQITDPEYGELNFSPPISMFSARVNGNSADLGASRIEAYDEDNNLIGCVDNIVEAGGLNNWVDRGIIASGPGISKLRFILGVADIITFADPYCTPSSCHADAWCRSAASNDGSSVVCVCKTGYENDGDGGCKDRDECLLGACGANTVCTNLPGTYNCTCKDGYESGFEGCLDIDECNLDVCSPNAACVNLPATYNCTCNDGFTGDGLTCTDVNECDHTPCGANASCTNNEGSYECGCNDGYEGDGTICTEIIAPMAVPTTVAPTAAPTSTPVGKVSSAVQLVSTISAVLVVASLFA